MRKIVLSSSEFDEVKNKAMANEPRIAKIRMADIEFTNLSIKEKIVDIQGKPISVNKTFIDQYIKLLGLNPKILSGVKDDENSNKVITQIINVLNEQKTRQENRELRMLVSTNKEVIDLVSNEIGGRISNKNFFNIAEQVADKYDLDIIDTSLNKSNGVVALNFISPNVQSVANLSLETHQFGVKLTNNLYSTEISDFNYRLVCTNGMTAIDTYSQMKLDSINPSEIDKLFNHVRRMADNQFIPKDFEALMIMAQNTVASINEVENGMFSLINRMNIPTDLPSEDKERLIAQFINTHFPEYSYRKAELSAKGYELEKMTPQDKKFVSGKMSVWDLVNRVTYFASNKASNFNETEKLQIIGGTMLSNKSHDLANQRIKLLSL